MNIKKTKTSNTKLFYLIALILMATTSTTMPISRASGGTSTSRSISGAVAPLSYIEAQEEREALSVDSQRAISLANESPAFQARIAGASYQFNSIYEEFSWSPKTANPSVVIDTVNVVYSHLDVDGAGTNIVATEDSGLTKVVDVKVQTGMGMRTYYSSANWDGWEFTTTYGIFEATAYWTVTQAYVPLNTITGENCNWPNNCDFSTWVGLAQGQGGSCASSSSGCIVQGGTASGQQCGFFGCGPNNGGYYYPWYEFVPGGTVACGGTGGSNIHYGDSYSEDVYQVPASGVYFVTGNDYTTGYGCSTNQNYTYFSDQQFCYYHPYPCANFAEVLAERPIGGNNNPEILPAFTQYTTSQCSIDSRYPPNGSTQCQNLAANEYAMTNCGYSNVGHTTPSSSDAWNTWYRTSNCT